MNINIELADLNKAIKEIHKLDVATQDRVKKGVNTSALNVQKGAKKRVAVDTGRLRSSITIEPYNGGLTMEVGTKVEYAPNVEFGTGVYGPENTPIVIRPKNKKALYWPGAAHPVKKVVQKGQRARPFLFPAFEAEKGNLASNLRKALDK